MIIYFTGTGNSKYCAETLGELLQDDIINSFQFIKQGTAVELTSIKPWIFVCPTYGWRIPRIFQTFIESGSFSGSKEVYFVMTCGSEIGKPEKYLYKLCEKKDLDYKGVFKVVMPENYIAMFDVPGEEKIINIMNEANKSLEEIANYFKCESIFPGNNHSLIDTLKSKIINPFFYKLIVKTNNFYTNDDCVLCGKCLELCPLNNITIKEEKVKWGKDCTHCMACISNCPNEAIEYGKNSIGQIRYKCWEKNNEKDLLEKMRVIFSEKGNCILAIDGRAASGKSTLAASLQALLRCDVIHMDDFFLPEELRTESRYAEPGGNIHYERFIQEVLPYLGKQKEFSYGGYNCKKGCIDRKVSIKNPRFCIVEGCYSCHTKFGDYADIKVVLDVDPDTQMRRIIKRNGEAQALVFKEKWIPLEQNYFKRFE